MVAAIVQLTAVVVVVNFLDFAGGAVGFGVVLVAVATGGRVVAAPVHVYAGDFGVTSGTGVGSAAFIEALREAVGRGGGGWVEGGGDKKSGGERMKLGQGIFTRALGVFLYCPRTLSKSLSE